MNKHTLFRLGTGLSIIAILLLAAACQPGMILGPKYTPTPTATLIPTATPTPTITPTPDPAILAGRWSADAEFGTVTFRVDETGSFADIRLYEFYSGAKILIVASSGEQQITDFAFTDTVSVGDSEFTFRFDFGPEPDGQIGIVTWEGTTPSGPYEGIGVVNKKPLEENDG